MRKLIAFIMLIFAFQTAIIAQQTDKNTFIINEYFQVSNEKPVIKNTTLPNFNAQSYVNLVQVGNENSIYVSSLQTGDSQIVNQVGSQNNYEYFNYFSKENTNLKVNQEGTLNSLQVFGENSLMKNAIINQKSNFKSLVIKNYQ